MTRARKAKSPAKQSLAKAPAGKSDACFVICPFDEIHNRYYDRVYRRAIEAAGLEPQRADDVYRPGAVIADIWTAIKSARALVAELSGRNPNVFYELGLAHAIRKPVVLLTQNIADVPVPFDLQALRVIPYDIRDPDWSGVLQDKIKKALKEMLRAPERAILPLFLNDAEVGQRAPSSVESRIAFLEQQVNVLRSERRSQSGLFSSPTIGTPLLTPGISGSISNVGSSWPVASGALTATNFVTPSFSIPSGESPYVVNVFSSRPETPPIKEDVPQRISQVTDALSKRDEAEEGDKVAVGKRRKKK